MRNSINKTSISEFSLNIKKVYKDFDNIAFERSILRDLNGDTGLFERLELVTKELKPRLPEDFPKSLEILKQSISDGRGFIILSISNYISSYGLDYFDLSMVSLMELTKIFTSEFAIRRFLIEDPERCFHFLDKWVLSDNVDVRRLVSEGLRPRLPWGIRLQNFVKDPTPIIKYLTILKDDKELYVRRSVANNLNDIAKDHPDLVVATLKSWKEENSSNELDWIIRHSLRTLIKQGDQGTLELLGYTINPRYTLDSVSFTKRLKLGETLSFSFVLRSETDKNQKLVVDYVIYHKKANGKKSPKVFKLKNMELLGLKTAKISRNHPIRPISTRKYYSGEHTLYIKINGEEILIGNFDLQV